MPKGNARDPFTVNGGLDWSGQENDPSGFKPNGSGSSPKDEWGNDAATGEGWIDKSENKRPDRESKYSNERTVLDKPLNASPARVKKTSAHAYEPDQWYRGSRKG